MSLLIRKKVQLNFVNLLIYKDINDFSSINGYLFTRQLSSKEWKKESHFRALGLQNNASRNEIREAYLEKCKEYHPDLHPEDNNMHKKFIRINEAYECLTFPMNHPDKKGN